MAVCDWRQNADLQSPQEAEVLPETIFLLKTDEVEAGAKANDTVCLVGNNWKTIKFS